MGFKKKIQPNSFNIAPNELKLGVWIKDGKVYIPTKFKKKSKNFLSFCAIYALPYLFTLWL